MAKTKFAKWLRAKGYTYAKFAGEMELDPNVVARWARGDTVPHRASVFYVRSKFADCPLAASPSKT